MVKSLQSKFLVGFLLIFAVFFVVLNLWMSSHFESGNRAAVKQQLQELKASSNSYIQQSFLLHHFTSDEMYFAQIAEELGSELRRLASSEVALYSPAGELLYASRPEWFSEMGEDVRLAQTNETAYTLTRAEGKAVVLFSYPFESQGEQLGIVRFTKDFTAVYNQSAQIQRTLAWMALAVFGAAFLFSILLSRHVTAPLGKLTKATTEVAGGNLQVHLQIKQQDEIGKLAENFSRMLEQLREQFSIIEQDRDRLEALNQHRKQFYDQVTHELKTPLTTIIGYTDMMELKGSSDPVLLDKGIRHIKQEGKRLHGLVMELLEKSGSSRDRYEVKEQINFTQIVQEVCESMEMKAQRYQKVLVCEVFSQELVWGKASRLRQLVINLLDNAIKYAYPHSIIDVVVSNVAEGMELKIGNEGENIAPESLERLFELYYQAQQHSIEPASLGLGLHICQAIVKEHQGQMKITSEHQRTEVIVLLPPMRHGREANET